MATTKDAEMRVQVLVSGCSSFRRKEGDGFVPGISYQLAGADMNSEQFRWLYLAEKQERQLKISVAGDPEGVIGHISGLKSKKGETGFAFVVNSPVNSQLDYLWDRIAGEDECSLSNAQGGLVEREE